jgi:uncharacterized phage infection (PIP) family protein YhgE
VTRVNLEVPDKTKERWEQAANNDPNAGGNLSGFIRAAVQSRINESESASEESGDVGEELADIKQMIQNLSESVDTANRRLSKLETEVKGDPDIEKLANKLFAQLPTKDEFDEWHSGQSETVKLTKQPTENTERVRAERGGDIEAFAEVIDHPLSEIREAVAWLRKEVPLVQETEINGRTRVYREDF